MARIAKKEVDKPFSDGDLFDEIANAMPPVKPTREMARAYLSTLCVGDTIGEYTVVSEERDDNREMSILILKHSSGKHLKLIQKYNSYGESFYYYVAYVTPKKIEKIIYE
jgi:hypothetical protein